MMERLLNTEGPVMTFLNKTGQLIGLSVLWLLSCIPIVTIPAATTALYYAVVKTVRFETGSAPKEYWRSFKANVLRGMIAGFPPALLAAIFALNLNILAAGGSNALRWGSLLGFLLTTAAGIYVCPILSRFTMKVTDVWKLSALMALRHLPTTVLILAAAVIGAAAELYFLPIPTLAVLPGAMCLAATWPMEKILRQYMPPKEEAVSNPWYYN